MQIVEIAIPLPSAIVPWELDNQGRECAEIPGFGKIVQLTDEQAAAAREEAKQLKDPIPLGFDLKFADGKTGLFMRADEAFDESRKSAAG